MSRFCSLSSSSKGNSMYLAGGNSSLLVDVGISCKRIVSALSDISIDPKSIEGILITHEHSDHIKGLKVLLNKFDIPVYATPKTLEAIISSGAVAPPATLIPIEGDFCVGDLKVSAFDTPHDAVHSVGYRIEMPDGRVVGIATDLGYVTSNVANNLKGCDLVMLESNFDQGMLSVSHYPYMLKRRIKEDFGHLSNEDCAEQVKCLVGEGTTHVVLGHLSENNNLPQIAYQTTKNVLDAAGMKIETDYILSVAPARDPQEMVVF